MSMNFITVPIIMTYIQYGSDTSVSGEPYTRLHSDFSLFNVSLITGQSKGVLL